jgi:hypothetical protein
MIELTYPAILVLFPQYLDPKRYESASFLMWYLEKYYLLDPREAEDCVCDKPGDKGIDGIFVNDDTKTITLFQSVITKTPGKTIGDGDKLSGFAGKFNHFKSPETIENLIASAGDAEIAGLVTRLELLNKIETYEVIGEFLANAELDSNGDSFLRSAPHITFVGARTLQQTYISDSREIPSRTPITFDVRGFTLTKYSVDNSTESVIAPIKARELVKMDGIANQSLFAYNVRGPLGKTAVNRAIVKTIKDQSKHKFFPLFHNGITVIAKELGAVGDTIRIADYFVVNGCQSLHALLRIFLPLATNSAC